MLKIIVLTAALLAPQIETTFTIDYGGKKYEFRVSDQDLQKTPVWRPDQENPPLSPRRAEDIARKQLASLVPNGKDWRLHEVTLRPLDNHWIYLVGFLEPLRTDTPAQQLSTGFQIIVLMNGATVTPRISP
jgi:hypothetical protein